MIGHIRTSSKNCGRLREMEYWKDTVEKWETWDDEFRVGLVNKWIELYRKKDKDCMICGKEYSAMKGVKAHVRKDVGCYEVMEKVVKEFPCGN